MWGRHVTPELTAYLHRELPEERMRLVEAHLQRCAACRAAHDDIQFAARLTTTLPLTRAPESIWNGLQAETATASRPKRLALRFGVAIGVAAALLVIIGVFVREAPAPATPAARVAGTPTGELPSPPDERPAQDVNVLPQPSQQPGTEGPSWQISSVRGTPRVGSSIVSRTGRLRVGEALHTDPSSEARLKVADVGELHVQPNSLVRLLVSRPGEHRIALERGRLEARSWARPRVFIVDTPVAAAVDLGCRYTLEVDDEGGSLLHVTSGVVALAFGNVETVVPAGASCRTRPRTGPGTPLFDTASDALRAALDRLDSGSEIGDRGQQLGIVLAEARPRDVLTLWHLLPRVDAPLRGSVYDRLAEFAPPPAGVTRDGIVALDPGALARWRAPVSKLWQSTTRQNQKPAAVQTP